MKNTMNVQKRVLAVCFMLLLGAEGLHAQSYTPVPYNFGIVSEVTDDTAGPGFVPTDLSMDCLSANGYGQWTASYKTQNAFDSATPGLFLLANSLRMPDINPISSIISSSGIVSFRPFVNFYSTGYPVDSLTNRSVVKSVTNLKGRVRYVWPSADHQHIIIEGFDECVANGDSGLTGINLEFASYPYNATYGAYPQRGADVIKAPSPAKYNFINIPLIHQMVNSGNEADSRDWLDIAMDTTNLYVVWESFDSTTGQYNIWEVTEKLTTGAFSPEMEVAAGARRPTIWADIRRAIVADSSVRGCFDVSYITGTSSSDHLTWYNYEYSRTPQIDTMVMLKTCQDTAGGTWTYKKILHARMLDASWEGIISSDSTPRAIYAIVTDGLNNVHLIMHKIRCGAQDAVAYYCDGTKISNHSYGVDDGYFPVIDKPIRAFVNPYDGEKDNKFNEYHCMYQLARTYAGGSHRPLMMIHGAVVHDTFPQEKRCLNFTNGYVSPGTVTNRPDPFHSFFADPGMNTDGGDTDNYVGAVNQMGIHTHWRNSKEHYYLRDLRIFDEDIEENTLATEDVYVGDGTTHGGDNSPTIQPGKTMTLWSTGGSYGEDDFPGDCYLIFQSPYLSTSYPATKLIVGTGSGSPSKMVLVWDAYAESDTSSQQIVIKPNSSLDVYGYSNFHVTLKLEGAGATMTGGTYSYPSSISSPAHLNLHGNSRFFASSILADSSIITNEYDQDVTHPIDSIDYTTLALPFPSSISNSIITNKDSIIPGSYYTTIESWDPYQNLQDTIFIKNSLVQYGRWTEPYPWYRPLPIVISGGKFENTPIWGFFAPHSLTIENVLFELTSHPYNSYGAGAQLFLKNDTGGFIPYQTYDPITISGCTFSKLPNNSDGIFLYGYASDSDIMQHVNITGNTFNNADWYSLLPRAAVEFQRSEGLITDNTIEGNFQRGIIISGENALTNHQTKSTICSNLIRAGTIAGIATDWTEGYAQLNNVKVPGAGHVSGVKDIGRIIYSNYTANAGSGIVVSSSSGAPDLTGIHSITADSIDKAAFDTISLNGGNAQISLVKSANIRLGNDHELWYWSDWCRNNIYTAYSDSYCGCLGGGVSYVPLIVEDSGKTISKLGNISHNYFGDTTYATILPENQPPGTGCNDTLNRGTPSSWLTSDTTPAVAYGFCYDADSNLTTWQNRPTGSVDCGLTLPSEKSKRIGTKSLSIQTIDTSTCQYKFSLGSALYQDDKYQQGDSELEWYIETCYDSGEAWQAFNYMGGYGFNGEPYPESFTSFREWLKSVLWLNTTDPMYYCTCAQDIYMTYESIDGGRNLNAALAVIRFLDSSNRCPIDSADNNNDYSQELTMRHQIWLDTVNHYHNGDTVKFPEDTTLPTIDDLDLQILRGPPAGVQNMPPSPTGISALTASENPFSKETTISFTMGEYSYVSFQVFDVLGRVIQGDYKGAVHSPGTYSFTVDGTNLSTGVYYARITTPIGETRTLKLVKE